MRATVFRKTGSSLGDDFVMVDPVGPTSRAGALAAFVGAIIIYYAFLEHWIDTIVYCIYERVEGAKKLRRQYPYAAAAKREFLKEAFEQLPLLAAYKSEGLQMLAALEPAANFRHDIAHGTLSPVDFNAGVLEFSRKIKGPDGKPIRRTITITASQLVDVAGQMLGLVPPTEDFGKRLLAQFVPEYQVEQPSGGS